MKITKGMRVGRQRRVNNPERNKNNLLSARIVYRNTVLFNDNIAYWQQRQLNWKNNCNQGCVGDQKKREHRNISG